MRVATISSCDISGGAARAAYRLHTALNQAGIESTMIVAAKASIDPTVRAVPMKGNLLAGLRRWQDRRFQARNVGSHAASIANGYEMFSSDRAPVERSPQQHLPPCDIINLHWVAGFLDYESFFASLPVGVPVVWTLHDMNPVTGGCHYDAGCGRFKTGCGKCPALDSSDSDDLSSQIFRRKSKALDRLAPERLHVVAPSRWLADIARSSPLLRRFECSVIPYGLNTELFKPIDRRASRQVLDLAEDGGVVLFVADQLESKRKGFKILAEALGLLSNLPGLVLLSIGRESGEVVKGVRHLSLGSVQNDRLLPMVYSAADVVVIPSLQDNLPNIVMEAMACGVPAVGFNVGGIPDMIREGSTGFLALPGNVADLAAAITKALSNVESEQLSKSCRSVALTEYAAAVQGTRYIQLYTRLLAAIGGKSAAI